MGYSIIDVIKDELTGNAEYVSAQIKKERLYVCSSCSDFRKLSRQCGICGCFVDTKAKYEKSECPKNRWVK
ncbi:MAG: DUF6171 family protein [Candidatus Nitrosotenuis sp.]